MDTRKINIGKIIIYIETKHYEIQKTAKIMVDDKNVKKTLSC